MNLTSILILVIVFAVLVVASVIASRNLPQLGRWRWLPLGATLTVMLIIAVSQMALLGHLKVEGVTSPKSTLPSVDRTVPDAEVLQPEFAQPEDAGDAFERERQRMMDMTNPDTSGTDQ